MFQTVISHIISDDDFLLDSYDPQADVGSNDAIPKVLPSWLPQQMLDSISSDGGVSTLFGDKAQWEDGSESTGGV
jgi:hypothetical protein